MYMGESMSLWIDGNKYGLNDVLVELNIVMVNESKMCGEVSR